MELKARLMVEARAKLRPPCSPQKLSCRAATLRRTTINSNLFLLTSQRSSVRSPRATRHAMAFPQNPNGMMAGMNPTAGMSEQEVQMTKMVCACASLARTNLSQHSTKP